MRLLLIDTALQGLIAAFVEGGDKPFRILAERRAKVSGGAAEQLLPAIEAARAEAGMKLADLDGLVATIGPGSFTGIRTGLSVARGLALALRKPLWGLTTTAILAAMAEDMAEEGAAVVAAIDARRAEIYLQPFRQGAPLEEPAILPLAEVAALLPPGLLHLIGSGAALLRDAAMPRGGMIVDPSAAPELDIGYLAAFARLGLARAEAGLPQTHSDGELPKPLYIRPPDAALPAVAQPAARLAVSIRPAGRHETDLLAAIQAEAFPRAWSASSIGDLMVMPGVVAFLALDGDQPVGFIMGRLAAEEAEVITLAALPRLRRLGIGSALLDHLLQAMHGHGARECFLEVGESNASAQALYRKAGFAPVGRRKDYYETAQGRESAIVMRKAPIGPVSRADGA